MSRKQITQKMSGNLQMEADGHVRVVKSETADGVDALGRVVVAMIGATQRMLAVEGLHTHIHT